MAGGIFFLWWGVQTQWQEWGREAGGLSVPCGGCLVCLLKKWAETGPSEGFQARTPVSYTHLDVYKRQNRDPHPGGHDPGEYG